jgi:hypothetical protein
VKAALPLLLLALLGLLLDGGVTLLATSSAAPAWAWAWLLGWALLLAGLTLCGLRWPAMGRSLRIGWALLALWTLASLLLAAWPWAQQRWLHGQPAATLQIADEGRSLLWRGAVAPGDAERLAAQLGQSPGVKRLDLQGSGGSFAEALRVTALTRERGLDTRASGPCQGACAALYMGGARRQLLPGGELGFQRIQVPSLNPVWQAWALQRQRAMWTQFGLSSDFVQRALLTQAPRWWTPDASDLLAQGGMPAPAYPLDLLLPVQPGAQPGEYLQALQSHPTWRLLEAKLPGTLSEAQALLLQAHGPGAEAAAQLALHRYAVNRERRLLAGASVEMRDLYLDLQKERLQALQSDADCHALLSGDAAVRRRLPAELARRERVWLEDAAVEPTPPAPSRHVVALDAEVLRKTWNRRALGLLDRLAPDGARNTPLDCKPAIELITELRGLQPAQRKPAQRRLFD